MEQENITLTKLTASEGMVLTDGESCGETVYLCGLDSPDRWREVTRAEYEALLAQNAEGGEG